MLKTFSSLEDLFAYMKEDKEWVGANAVQHNRYPIRFVLFDNFSDFNQFIIDRPSGIFKHSIDSILDKDHPDQFLSYTELSKEIRSFANKIPINDFIIYPFSEMARFYDNSDGHNEFNSLLTTIRGQQASEDAQNEHVRIYIPIVGMQGKMGKFSDDNITFVWEYKSGNEDTGIYNLVTTDGTTYGVAGLNERYMVVQNLYEWLKLWEKGEGVKRTIICTSPNIYANVHNAQPDNAFKYLKCENVFRFLTKGLSLDFGLDEEEPDENEMPYWEQFAKEIDVTTFTFDEFVKERFDTFTLKNGLDFIKLWFDCDTDFDRWLIALYFKKVSSPEDYIYQVISKCQALSKSEIFSVIATYIFEVPNNEVVIEERRQVMRFAADKGVKITDLAKTKLMEKLSSVAVSPEQGGFDQAVKLLTPLTDVERQLCIEWVAKGNVKIDKIKDIYPGLYHYLEPLSNNSIDKSCQWITDYFTEYKFSKIADVIRPRARRFMGERNADESAFHAWYDNFKTVKTILHDRKDIDVFYWIDGLGVDWVPFICDIVSQYSKEHIYLNEVYVAVADLPTVTSVNKVKLQSLLPDNSSLPKIGDIDSFAHSTKSYPQYIIEEMGIVDQAIRQVLDNYNGKKIAFISDHGITYLSQHESGLKLGGVNSDHEGRLATYTGSIVSDSKYIRLDDSHTICALTYNSLTDKVSKGHGAHGGCTPEEVLVPVIIVSSQKNANVYSVEIENDEIDGTYPMLRCTIKGLSSVDIPTLMYNEVTYHLANMGDNIFESERLNLVDTATRVKICINDNVVSQFSIRVSTGAMEDDLFDSF